MIPNLRAGTAISTVSFDGVAPHSDYLKSLQGFCVQQKN
jgi:hypothetical protein